MTIHQLSVFIENKSGSLLQILKILKDSNIQLIAANIADTEEYGILRMICDEPLRAYNVLKENMIAAALTDVYAVEISNEVGGAYDVVGCITRKGISLTYIYTFFMGDRSVLIFRTDNTERTEELLTLNNINVIAEEELPLLSKIQKPCH